MRLWAIVINKENSSTQFFEICLQLQRVKVEPVLIKYLECAKVLKGEIKVFNRIRFGKEKFQDALEFRTKEISS